MIKINLLVSTFAIAQLTQLSLNSAVIVAISSWAIHAGIHY